MNRILFACDLDNTLIYSWKHRREGDLCVEWIDGKEQGYMPSEVASRLRSVRQLVEFVPVTTRSIAQYQRIVWPQGCCPRYAITTHGANLLCDGKVDQAWERETAKHTAAVMEPLLCIRQALEETGEYLRCRLVDQAYAFVYCRNDSSALETAMNYPLPEGIYRVRSGKKIYFIPQGIDKGSAVARFRDERSFDTTICAGDSEMDIPMLQMGDISFVPNTFSTDDAIQGNIHVCQQEHFAGETLAWIEHMANDR